MNVSVLSLILGHDFGALTERHAGSAWEFGWKPGKAGALENPNNPFVGGPKDLIAAGVTRLSVNGVETTITPMTRIRVRELEDDGLKVVGEAMGKDLLAMKKAAAGKDSKFGGRDVVHQEFVATFEENVANSTKHLLNNLSAVAAVVDALATMVFNEGTTVEEAIKIIEGILDGSDAEKGRLLSMAVRAAWFGRAVQDGSFKSSADYNHTRLLSQNAADLDPYVAAPVLMGLLRDLKNGYYNK